MAQLYFIHTDLALITPAGAIQTHYTDLKVWTSLLHIMDVLWILLIASSGYELASWKK